MIPLLELYESGRVSEERIDDFGAADFAAQV